MDSITVENFRCFREEQTARLAPLTLLAGENSTGKTSFLALIRALWDIAIEQRVPDFKEDPFDLGSFREIAYNDGDSGTQTDEFSGGFEMTIGARTTSLGDGYLRFATTLSKGGSRPIPTRRRYSRGEVSIRETYGEDRGVRLQLTTGRGSWKGEVYSDRRSGNVRQRLELEDDLFPIRPYLLSYLRMGLHGEECLEPEAGSPPFEDEDRKMVNRLIFSYNALQRHRDRPFASAPVRSKPRRTYDPSRPSRDPEGDYIPMYLARLHSQDTDDWELLRKRLNEFGQESGLFYDIHIEQFGDRDGGPFQLWIRKSDAGINGPTYNLVDVGYGVSQVLPLVTELFRKDAPNFFLLQQPEIHLHPSAQAALGSLFCQVASRRRQLIVETHSDHLMDRVRMDVRDGITSLTPDDVSLLFFERGGSGVNIHSIRFDEQGSVLDTPKSYRQFFMRETRRSLGL